MTEQLDVITVSDEEGHEHELTVLGYIEVDERQYVVVVPSDAAADGAATVLRVEDDETLVGVDDEELHRVVDELADQRDDLEIELADPKTTA